MEFIHLHTHSYYSLLDALKSPEELVKYASKLSMPAIALTDHGNLFGVYKFYRACKEANIKPIIGEEFYLVPDQKERTRFFNHIILLAKNKEGWKNLMKLSSDAFTNGFYYRARIDYESIKRKKEGLIILSGCCQGPVTQKLLDPTTSGAKKIEEVTNEVVRWKRDFGEEFYLEIMPINYEQQRIVNKYMNVLSKKYDICLVATGDVHYIKPEEDQARIVQMKVRNPKWEINSQDLYFRTGEEMYRDFIKHQKEEEISSARYAEAIANTLKIANEVEEFDIKSKCEMPDPKTIMEECEI